jgi:hypothetical protein
MPARAQIRAIVLIVGLSLLGAFAFAGRAGALVHNGALDINKAVATEQTIQIVRDLHFKRDVGVTVMTPDQVAKMLAVPKLGDPSDDQIAAEGVGGAMLGLFPQGIDLKSASIETLKEQLLAFYDFNTRHMVVIDGGDQSISSNIELAGERAGQRDYLGYLILAHEYTHALQDQNFHLGDKLRRLREDTDAELALRSVAEGDATLAGWGYVLGKMDVGTVQMLESDVKTFTKDYTLHPKGGSLAAYEYFNFPYVQGLRFVSEAYKRGGWAAVDALYRDPPESTAQIMEPSLYFDHRTRPLEVDLYGYDPMLDGWQMVESDTSGELALQVILERNLGVNSQEITPAFEWAGDRLALFRRNGEIGAVWLIAFRDQASARNFAATYKRVLDRALGNRAPHLVENRDSAVLVIAGAPARLSGLAASIWKSSVIAPPQPRDLTASVDLDAAAADAPRRQQSAPAESAGVVDRVKQIIRHLAASQSKPLFESGKDGKDNQGDPDLLP